MKSKLVILFVLIGSFAMAQKVDSTQIGKEYPYKMPFLGKKAYERGYELPLPHGLMVSTLFNRQDIVLDNFSMAFTQPGEEPDFERLQPVSDLIVFGPSSGRINTLNFRFDTWLFPFFSVGGYYGRVWGEQVIRLEAPIAIESVTDIKGQYYGINLLGVAPLGPVAIAADYSWSWTTNERLDRPVLVKVSGLRVIKRIPTKTKGRYWAFWGGAQFQNLDNQTSGEIGLGEALNLDGAALDALDDRLDGANNDIAELEAAWDDYTMSPEWDDLSRVEQARQTATYTTVLGVANTVVGVGESASEMLRGLSETTVHYKFDKRLQYEWNMLLGFNYQHSPVWQFRTEYGFLKSKQQLMVSLNYRFGL